ncbi:AbrB/MazE/SpoVT family DNA-binding domain-containing protein [Candidatus Woesearchaeota archaeon]|nr:AbrB/MazE/SpoVT family DNA-binding domain-containing protein [Candidatus Woesearchaeota archaeon]
MPLAHITQSGNIFLPRSWREELGIEADSKVLIEKKSNTIIIMPLKQMSLEEEFREIDEEIKRKKITFTREEAIRDDFYE